ncbi:MAG: DUF5652 family protein [Candidatus Paceibacterota bacterium]|jgi:hypothetical protein
MMNQLNPFLVSGGWGYITIILLVWTLFWKGCSLWIAGKRDEKWWFLALLVLNTAGILDIVYIFLIAKKKWSDVQGIFTKKAPQNQSANQ